MTSGFDAFHGGLEDRAPAAAGAAGAEWVFDSPDSAAAAYEERAGWRVTHSSRQVWLMARFEVEAMMMPEDLGAVVLQRLVTRGPVVRFPGPPVMWAFLTQPQNVLRDSRRLVPPVQHLQGGAMVWLPPSNWSHEPLSWISPPTATLPSFTVVTDVVQRALRHYRTTPEDSGTV